MSNKIIDTGVLRQFITAAYPLKGEELEKLLTGWQPFECKRKTILTAAGETERYLYFVVEGIQRGFYIGNDNQEATVVFTYPPSFSGLADSFLTQTPSKYFMETLTASKFLRITYKQMEELMNQYPNIQKMILYLTGFVLKGVLERQIELQCFSAEEKFRSLLKRSPHVLQIIPHKYLASYLGIDATTFSKLMSSVRL
ncbi:Crp/Fnr family transcriptional regulator [Terrimonas pollutisoli]|uniref:Crp/Fnr family transcriptional regulator n=1 Tax=Terrimonas pollutisoli TaxID=3034147 RepID=UPI0023EB4129|nr:Crp/Fnr family transcriptional regulator [Terrimonas sp. H1YJ31]